VIDYTSAANKQDRYLRDGGPAYSQACQRRQLDILKEHHHWERLNSEAAIARGIDSLNEIEGKVRFPRLPKHNPNNNPHDE
jgi:hypothetical protein